MGKDWYSVMDTHFGVKKTYPKITFKKIPKHKPESLDSFKAKYVIKKQCWFDKSAEEIEKMMRENRMKIESKY